MKSQKLKYALWGAGIFGVAHLIIAGLIVREGGDAGLALVLIDLPLYILSEKFFSERYFVSLALIFGTALYALFGGLIFFVLMKIKNAILHQSKFL